MNRVERQKDKVAKNASNKRKWEGDHCGSSSQNKKHKVIRAYIAEPSNKKGYAGNLPLCNKCKFHHTGPYAAKCGNCKRKAEVTCYECGRLGHYQSGCPERKNQNQVNKQWKETCGDSSVMANNVNV
ncbi:reverse transcriptase domain-containing protein [Tanacetum coccineum]|uniref:Reverse transcriptase domain-containing protein n=1 Tax=Tanacetum coccineum TaxID=301880 RepID=A0ABQ5E2A3_9ASTR